MVSFLKGLMFRFLPWNVPGADSITTLWLLGTSRGACKQLTMKLKDLLAISLNQSMYLICIHDLNPRVYHSLSISHKLDVSSERFSHKESKSAFNRPFFADGVCALHAFDARQSPRPLACRIFFSERWRENMRVMMNDEWSWYMMIQDDYMMIQFKCR